VSLELLPDLILTLLLLIMAWGALYAPQRADAMTLFIAFGIVVALIWARLDAPDLALAEAAIGAGLTGALLLAALARLRSSETNREAAGQPGKKGLKVRGPQWLPVILLLPVAAGLGYVVLSLPPNADGLSAQVAANLETSGVSNPVTAVLLNFRSYDTLLEMAVLLLALLGVWSLGGPPPHAETAPGPVLDSLARLLTPVLVLVAAYLLWIGAHAPGGAFQAGAVLGAAGVLLLLANWRLRPSLARLPLRLTLVAGPAAFVAIAALMMLWTGRLLE
jgi:multisubunit Na+/H+ antiporter MnhB subunit